MPLFPEWQDEVRSLSARRFEDQRREWIRGTTSPDTADRLTRSLALYDADPATHLSLAQAGVDPERDAGVWARFQAASQVYSSSRGALVGNRGPAGNLVDPGGPRPVYRSTGAGAEELVGFTGVEPGDGQRLARIIATLVESQPTGHGARDAATFTGHGARGDVRQGSPLMTERSLVRAIEEGYVDVADLLELDGQILQAQGEALAPQEGGGGGGLFGSVAGFVGDVAGGIQDAGAGLLGLSSGTGPATAGTPLVGSAGGSSRGNPLAAAMVGEVGQRITDGLSAARRAFQGAMSATPIDDYLEPIVNVGVQVLDTPYQLTQAAARSAYRDWNADGFGMFVPDSFDLEGLQEFTTLRAVDIGLQTSVGTMAADVGEEFNRGMNVPRTIDARPGLGIGEGVNIGEGYFYSGPGEDFRGDYARGVAEIQDQTFTIGRYLASPFDAGSKPHTILSGLVDAGLALAGPGELAIDSAFDAALAARSFRTTEGGIPALRLGDALAAADYDDAVSILRGAGASFTDQEVARLAAANTFDEVVEAVRGGGSFTPRMVDEIRGGDALAQDVERWLLGHVDEARSAQTAADPGSSIIARVRSGDLNDAPLYRATGGDEAGSVSSWTSDREVAEFWASGRQGVEVVEAPAGTVRGFSVNEVVPDSAFAQQEEFIGVLDADVPNLVRGVDPNAQLPMGAMEALRSRWGAIRGIRPTIDPRAVEAYLDGKHGARAIGLIADTDSTHRIDQITRGTLDPGRLAQYADETDPTVLRAMLGEDLGLNITGGLRGRRPAVIDAVRDMAPRLSRLGHAVPSGSFDLDNGRRLLDQLGEWSANTGANTATVARWHDRMSRAATRSERFNVLNDFFVETAMRTQIRTMGGHGSGVDDIVPEIARRLEGTGADPDEVLGRLLRHEAPMTGDDALDLQLTRLRTRTEQMWRLFSEDQNYARVYAAAYNADTLEEAARGLDVTIRTPDVEETVRVAAPIPDTRGQGTYFHGAANPIAGFDESYYANTNFYGEGFYTSDSQQVAARYKNKDVRRGRDSDPRVYRVNEVNEVNFFDLGTELPTGGAEAVIREQFGEGAFADKILDALELGNDAGVDGIRTWQGLYDAIRRGSGAEGLTRDDVYDVVDSLRQRLMDEGYGGLTHRGKHKLVGDGDYDVRVYWRPWDDIEIEEVADEFVDEVRRVEGPVETVHMSPESVHLHNETINRHVPMPDARQMRRYFSNYRGILLSGDDLRVSTKVHNWLLGVQSGLWKPAVLLRAAWPVRVVGEEQLRLAAGGYTSLAWHPLQHISAVIGGIGGDGTLARTLSRLGDDSVDLLGRRFQLSDEWAAAMSSRVRGGTHGHGRRLFDTRLDVDEARARELWADELGKITHDSVGGMVLRADSLDEAKETFWNNMASIRSDLAASGRTSTRGAPMFDVTTRAGADAYVESVYRRIEEVAGNNPEVIEAMRTGRIGEATMGRGDHLNPDFVNALEGYADSMPRFLPGWVEDVGGGRFSAIKEGQRLGEEAVEWMFGALMGVPTNNLSRSPVFRQAYWDEVVAIAPRIDSSAAETILRNAEEAGLDRATISQLRRTIGTHKGPNDIPLSAEEADLLAKGVGLDTTQELLFDVSKRNQFFDSLSIVFPFGDAWAEVLTRWARLVREDPMVVRRAEQVIEAGRDTGIIYENDRGEEVFSYPLSGAFMENMSLMPGIGGAAPIPLTGRLNGLSLATEMYPGIGPVMSLPVAAALPDSQNWDWLRDTLFPYGEPNVGGNPFETAYSELVPVHWRRVATGLSQDALTDEEQRQYATSFGQVLALLGDTGEYDVFSSDSKTARDEWTRLIDDAHEANGALWFGRGLAVIGAGAPSSPSPEFYYNDTSGNAVHISAVRELYQKVWEENPDDPLGAFLAEYDVWALAGVQGKTISQYFGGGVPPTAAAEEWVRSNPDFVDQFELVAGYFAPQGGDIDFNAWNRQLEDGDRIPLTEEQMVSRFLHTLGSYEYNKARDAIVAEWEEAGWDMSGTYPVEIRRYLEDLDDDLVSMYGSVIPSGGYQGRSSRWNGPSSSDDATARAMLRDAIEAPEVADTDLAGAVRTYFETLDSTDELYREHYPQGTTNWYTSRDGQSYRQYVVDMADYLIAETPEFRVVWEEAFEPLIREGLEADLEAEEE